METKEIIQYQMSQSMFDELVSTRKGKDKKKNPWKYVLEVVNSEYGLKGYCNKIVIKG